jgi:predicted nuclease of predicted toxin-antitoxin system
VTGRGIRLYTDEMISPRLAETLRQRGYDARSCHEVARGNQGIPDEEQLAYAASDGRAIFTENATDFYALDAAWKANGRAHAGIIVFGAMTFSALLRRVVAHLDTVIPKPSAIRCSGYGERSFSFGSRKSGAAHAGFG